MRFSLHFVHYVRKAPLFIDDKSGAQDSHVFLSHKLFQPPCTVGVGHRMVIIRQKREIERMLFFEFCQTRRRIRAYPNGYRIELCKLLLRISYYFLKFLDF